MLDFLAPLWNEGKQPCFVEMICRNDLKDIDEKVKKANTHLEKYCKQQNPGFIDNSNL